MEQTEENTGLSLYKSHRITEWHEKCQVLSIAEQIQVLEEVRQGIDSELIAMVRLPFPAFVQLYFQNTNVAYRFQDPTFAYKLYLLDDKTIRYFSRRATNPTLKEKDIVKIYRFGRISEVREKLAELNYRPLEEMPYQISVAERSKTVLAKFVYLTQYIDLKEAERLNLKSASSFVNYSEDGYMFAQKLDLLNPAARQIVELFLGLNGERRHNQKEIAERLGLSWDHVKKFVAIVLPSLVGTLSYFKSSIGYIGQEEGNMHEYSDQKPLKEIDISLEAKYAFNQLAVPIQERLMSLSPSIMKSYLVSKYMYTTPDSYARAMKISPLKAIEQMNTFSHL